MWDWVFAAQLMPDLLRGLLVTVKITLLASALAFVLALATAVIWRVKVPVLAQVLLAVSRVIRGTPLLVQLYLYFFVLPAVLPALSPEVTAVLGLGINFSTYMAETLRGAIEAVPRTQWEVATALNFTSVDTWRHVILPQVAVPSLPVLGNYVNAMFKISALASAIGVGDLFKVALTAGNDTFRYVEPITLAGLLYLLISVPLTVILRRLEISINKKWVVLGAA